jgi:hypothetical protein
MSNDFTDARRSGDCALGSGAGSSPTADHASLPYPIPSVGGSSTDAACLPSVTTPGAVSAASGGFSTKRKEPLKVEATGIKAAEMARKMDRLMQWLRVCAANGRAMPDNEAIALRLGYGTIKGALYVINKTIEAGLIRMERHGNDRRALIVETGQWTSWETEHQQAKPVTQRSTSSYRSPAQRDHIQSVKTVIKTLPPVTDKAEAARLIRDAIAAGRVTRCPPRCAAPIQNGTGL